MTGYEGKLGIDWHVLPPWAWGIIGCLICCAILGAGLWSLAELAKQQDSRRHRR